MNISSTDMSTITVYKLELDRVKALGLSVDPSVITWMEHRIRQIERPPLKLVKLQSLNWYGSTTDIICDWVWYLFLYTPST